MKRLSLCLLVVILTSVLAACGGNYTGTQSLDSLASPTVIPGSVPTAAPATAAPATTTDAAATSAPAATTEPAATTAPAATTGAAPSSSLPDLKGRAVLIGTDSTYPPFESISQENGQIVGFDPDLMAEIAKLINIKPEFKTTSFDTIFTALAAKQFDAVMSAVTITDERKEKVDFSDPYVSIGQQVVALKSNTAIKTYTDLKTGNLKVGVQRGTTGEKAAIEKAGVADENVKRYDDIAVAFADLKNNAIDAIVADGPTVANYSSQDAYKDVVLIVGEAFTTEDYGIAVQKGDTELLNAINAALAELKKQGKVDELKQKYEIKE